MQPSDQQPPSTNESASSSIDSELEKLPEEPQPLYEFPPASDSFVYPPPPSYYQNMPNPGELPPLPAKTAQEHLLSINPCRLNLGRNLSLRCSHLLVHRRILSSTCHRLRLHANVHASGSGFLFLLVP
jgi:hypothetical protein